MNWTKLREDDIRAYLEGSEEGETHAPLQIDFEHDNWFCTCVSCGKQWSIHKAVPGPYCLEEVSAGDESCFD